MPQTRATTIYAQRLILEYNRARKILRKYFKKTRHSPEDTRRKLKETIENTTRRQSKIIGYILSTSYNAGLAEGNKIVGGTLSAASEGFDLSQVSDTHLNKITKDTIGHIGKYNGALSKQLMLEYDTLLADNTLVTSLSKDGWTPWLDKALEARGVNLEVISLAKGQTTTAKMIHILELEGIRGGKHPREVAKGLLPHIQRYFGPGGVTIDNVGKIHRVLNVDADGNYQWVQKKITKAYKATPKSYANLLSRSSMINAHHEGRYQSLQKSGLVDHYISVSVLGPRTCDICAMMHGKRVSHAEGPLYHPMCMCDLKPFWKKDTGLKYKDPSIYEKESNQHFWNQHQLKEFNKTMPHGKKLKFYSMLPKDALKAMPDKAAMRAIRYEMLGKPAGIKPKVPLSKPKTLATMNDEEIANKLWEDTGKDGKEHAMIRNGIPLRFKGDEHCVTFKKEVIPTKSFELHHTHPSLTFDSPLSGADIEMFLYQEKMSKMTAASHDNLYVVTRTPKTYTNVMGIRGTFDHYSNKYFLASCKEHGISIPKKCDICDKLWYDACIKANKKLAEDYRYKFEVINRWK